MDGLSRRGFLLGGSALGAVGALGIVAPADAWTWSATGSVIGSGSGADPRYVWDDEADAFVAALFERDEVDRVNELLAGWTHNDQPLPEGLPSDLHAFLEQARQLPSWTDQAKLRAGVLVLRAARAVPRCPLRPGQRDDELRHSP